MANLSGIVKQLKRTVRLSQDNSRHFDRPKCSPADRSPALPANQYPVAALKQRIALVHPLAQAAGLLSIFRSSIERF